MFFENAKPFSQLVGLFFLLLVGMIMAGGVQALIPIEGEGAGQIRMMLVVQAVSQLLMFLIPVLVFAGLFHSGIGSYLKLKGKGSWRLALISMVMVVLLMPLNDVLTWWNEGWRFGPIEESMRRMSEMEKEMLEKMVSLTTVGDLVLQLVIIALVPAVCEELFFRGGVQQILSGWFKNRHVAVIVAALVFSLAHGDMYGAVPRFVMGLLLGYLFAYSGSMVVNISAHFFNNAAIVVMYYLYNRGELSMSPTEPLLMPWYVVVMCTVAVGILFVVYFLKNSSKEQSNL